ncbi:MAG: ABC transporter ATP-binding protein/permease [Cyanobacteria bacterium P01_G01_bin.19]
MFSWDSKPIEQFWQIAQPYWYSRGETQGRKLLFMSVCLSIISSVILAIETIQRGEIISALAIRDGDRFWQTIIYLSLIIIVSVPLLSFKTYIESKLALNWRKWLTDKFLHRYLEERRFYYLNNYSTLDNPDRTIAEDINEFSQQSLFLFLQTLDGLVQLIAFIGILWLVYKPMVLFLLIYSVVGTGILFLLFISKLTSINIEQYRREADLRFGLIKVRDNTESIAFYGSEVLEESSVREKLKKAIANFNRLIKWQFNLDLFQNGFQFSTMILPAILLAPSIFAGNIEIGAISQSQIAFERIWLSLSLIIFQFEKITALAAGIKRIADLNEYLKSLSTDPAGNDNLIKIKTSKSLAFENVTLSVPDRNEQIIENLSLKIEPEKNILIVGNSGVGKTSLVRAIGGLWNSGSGSINKPRSSDILFLPQSPYLILGTFKEQLLYPYLENNISEDKLLETIDKVNLGQVLNKFGTLDANEDWSRVLSRGEQQRLAFARLLLHQPKYAILDESTSALDGDNQDSLYRILANTNTTYISVGHRPNLLLYHQQVLQLIDSTTWSLIPAQEFSFNY